MSTATWSLPVKTGGVVNGEVQERERPAEDPDVRDLSKQLGLAVEVLRLDDMR